MRMCLRSISSIASTLATLPNLQYVNLGYNMLDGELHRSCNLTSTKACPIETPSCHLTDPQSSCILHSMQRPTNNSQDDSHTCVGLEEPSKLATLFLPSPFLKSTKRGNAAVHDKYA